MVEPCFQCGGAGRVTSVSPARAVREVPCPRCSTGADPPVGTSDEARRPSPARVAVTLLVWAAALAVALLVLSFVAYIALLGRIGGMGSVPK